MTCLQATHRAGVFLRSRIKFFETSIVDVEIRFTRVRMVSRSLQVLLKKYFSYRLPVKLSLAGCVPETGIMEWWSNGVMHLPPRTFDFTTWWGACPERKSKDRFFARLAFEIFLSSLQSEFFQQAASTGCLHWCIRFYNAWINCEAEAGRIGSGNG